MVVYYHIAWNPQARFHPSRQLLAMGVAELTGAGNRTDSIVSSTLPGVLRVILDTARAGFGQ